jgi:hypothetical protein
MFLPNHPLIIRVSRLFTTNEELWIENEKLFFETGV